MTSVQTAVVVVPALALGAAAALVDVTYRPLRHVATAVHEAGHAVAALACGRRLRAVRLNRDSSGETVSVGRSRGAGVVITLLAGYPAPSLVGLAGVWSVGHAQARGWIIALLVVMGVVALVLRNLFGAAVLAACILGLVMLVRGGAPSAEAGVMGASAFLLVAGLRGALELRHAARGPNDAKALAAATRLGAAAWTTVFVLVAAAALGAGAWAAMARLGAVSAAGVNA